MMKTATCSGILTLTLSAPIGAEMLNISASGLHSGDVQQIACTIVSNDDSVTVGGFRMLAVFAESGPGGRNTRLMARSLLDSYSYEISNNDWRGVITVNGVPRSSNNESLFSRTLRKPKSDSDSAFVYWAVPGERLCAFSNEEGGAQGLFTVDLSITDITEAYLVHFNVDGSPR